MLYKDDKEVKKNKYKTKKCAHLRKQKLTSKLLEWILFVSLMQLLPVPVAYDNNNNIKL